jgi:hypothetical protein
MAHLSQTTAGEECDSNFDSSSDEEDEPTTHKDSIHECEEERQNQIIV